MLRPPLLALAALLLAGCGSSTGAQPAAVAPGYGEVRVRDCQGIESRFTAPPQRALVLTPSVLEPLYWLGVADHVADLGQPPRPGSLPPQFRAQADQLPALAGKYVAGGGYQPVPKEQLLAARPDLVLGGFPSNFAAKGAVPQQELADSGIPSYLALSTSCKQALDGPQTDLGLVYRDIDNLSRVFGVADRGAELLARMRGQIDAVSARVANTQRPSVFAFEYDEGTQTPNVPGNRQTVNAVITLAGGRNLFDDMDRSYDKVGWEPIAARDPDTVLLIIYDTGEEARNAARFAEAERFVREQPALSATKAVRAGRFARLVYEYGSVGGVRNAQAVELLADQLHPR
ncbi:ABC transporter substrate-binding protein [Nocardia panacis]|nr:ABC transporter substrate-binding protein [Nocardia panacis]